MDVLLKEHDNIAETGSLTTQLYRDDGPNSGGFDLDEELMQGYFRHILEKMLDEYTFIEAVHSLPQNRPPWLDDDSIRRAFYDEYEFFDALKNPAIVNE